MYSSKWIDLSIMRAMYSIIEQNRHNTSLGRQEIIDLKFHMHSFSFLDAKKKQSTNRKTREEWEKRHNLPENSSPIGSIFDRRKIKHEIFFSKFI
jgi:hypothetical protein